MTFIGLCALCLPSPPSHAYTNQCSWLQAAIGCREPIWENATTDPFRILKSSFPAGSAEREELVRAMDAWQEVSASRFTLERRFDDNPDGLIIHGDGLSELGFADLDSVARDGDQMAGGARVILGYGLSRGWYIKEADILFDADRLHWFGNPLAGYYYDPVIYDQMVEQKIRIDDEFVEAYGSFFGQIAVHELGHAIGFGHDTTYSRMVMRTDNKTAFIGENPFATLPDDRKGMRDFYPGDGSVVSFGVAHQFVSAEFDFFANEDVSFLDTPDFYEDPPDETEEWLDAPYIHHTLCPGDRFGVTKTVLNLGTEDVTFNAKYYFSTDPVIEPSDRVLKSTSITVGKESDFRNTVKLEVPFLSGGDYYVGIILDPESKDETSEELRSNNAMVFGVVTVKSFQECVQAVPIDRSSPGDWTKLPPGRLSPTPLIVRASAIHDVTIEEVESRRADDGFGIYSVFTAGAHETVFGDPAASLSIRMDGGVIEDADGTKEALILGEAPALQVGQRYVIFLGANFRDAIPFAGGEMGVFPVVEGPGGARHVTTWGGQPIVGYAGGAFIVRPDHLRRPDGDVAGEEDAETGDPVSLPVDRSALDAAPMPLEDFLSALRSHIAERGPFEPISYDPAPVTAVIEERPRRPPTVRGSFLRGDCRDDGNVDISDAITALGALFLGTAVPGCADACDANDDGRVDVSDPVFTLGVLFLGQGPLPYPGAGECGPDPSADALRCLEYAGCP